MNEEVRMRDPSGVAGAFAELRSGTNGRVLKYFLAAIVVALAVLRTMPAVACNPGECAFPTSGGTFCGDCSGCTGPNRCLQVNNDTCITCGGPCEPRNDGLQGCGGPAACLNNTFPCTQDGVHKCCQCDGLACGSQCCAADEICNPGEGGTCTNRHCDSGVGCFGQCCAKGESSDARTLSCFSGPQGLCPAGKKACVDPGSGEVACCGKGQVCEINARGAHACVAAKKRCNGKYCTKTDIRGQEVRICCGKSKQCTVEPVFHEPSCR